MTLMLRSFSTNGTVHNKINGLCTDEDKIRKAFRELLIGKKEYVKDNIDVGVSSVVASSEPVKDDTVVEVSEVVANGWTIEVGKLSDASIAFLNEFLDAAIDVNRFENRFEPLQRHGSWNRFFMSKTGSNRTGLSQSAFDRLTQTETGLKTGSVMNFNRFVHLYMQVNIKLDGNATGGALLWKILEDVGILAACSSVLFSAYVAGRWVLQKYRHRGIKKYVLSPQNVLYVFKMEGVMEGTVHTWVDNDGVLRVTGMQRKNDKLNFKGLQYQLRNGYALAHATHYAKLEVVAVNVYNQRINVDVDVENEELREMSDREVDQKVVREKEAQEKEAEEKECDQNAEEQKSERV
ncbi:hypothetical protein CTI12_AA006840 [Artemisia annua]|uniref:Uncharacterized protein n=1 Tax=Artemisia annua TaxID=35608 RepID=A0A2U1Q3A9_ARTAN|nr:hypothetical protein CTI12_AA006840 [Artemisia annua]